MKLSEDKIKFEKSDSIDDLYERMSDEDFVKEIRNHHFDEFFLRLRFDPNSSSKDEFRTITSISDVIGNAKCDCQFEFESVEEDYLGNKQYTFTLYDDNYQEYLGTFRLRGDNHLSDDDCRQEFMHFCKVLVGRYDYDNSCEYYSLAVNNCDDEIYYSKDELQGQLETEIFDVTFGNFEFTEYEKAINCMKCMIADFKEQGFTLFKTKEEIDDFIVALFKEEAESEYRYEDNTSELDLTLIKKLLNVNESSVKDNVNSKALLI